MTEHRFTVTGLNYPDACAVIDRLKLSGIRCNLSCGSVSVYATPEQVPAMKEACSLYGGYLQGGVSAEYEDAVFQHGSLQGIESLKARTIAANKLLESHND